MPWRPGMDFGELVAPASEVPAGSDGLLFLPYLTGERSPHADPLARGAFVGLTLGHDRRHLTRAVLEGVAFGLRDGLDQMLATGMPAPAQVRASGGGTASAALAPDPRRRAADRDRDRRHDRGSRLRRRPCWRRSGRAGIRRSKRRGGAGQRPPRSRPRVRTRERYAEAYERYRGLYPALAPDVPSVLTGCAAGAVAPLRCAARPARFSVISPGFLPMMIIARTSSLVTVVLVDRPDELALEHDRDPVGQVEHVVDVVADQEDAEPFLLQLGDQLVDLGRLGRPEGRRRLVHDQDLGVEMDRARDRDAPGADRRTATGPAS